MFGLNLSKWYFWVLLQAGFIINSFANLTDDEYRVLASISADTELIEIHTRAIESNTDGIESALGSLGNLVEINQSLGQIESDVDVYFGWFNESLDNIERYSYQLKNDVDIMKGYLGNVDTYTHSLYNVVKPALSDLVSQLQVVQSNDEEFYHWVTNNYPILTIENIESLLSTNNLQNAQFYNDWRDFMDSDIQHLADGFNQVYEGVDGLGGLFPINQLLQKFYDDWYYVMEVQYGTIGELFYEIMYGAGSSFGPRNETDSIYGINKKLEILNSLVSNQLYYADMGIVTNIYYNTQSLSNNVEFIANYISTNKVDVENPISQSESEANSLFSLNTAETFYTNKITKTVDLNPEEAPDFHQYTNVTDIVSSIKDSYQYQQYQSSTNQLINAMHGIKDGFAKYLDDFKKSDLFTTKYNTRVVLIEKGSIKEYPDLELKFDFAEMNLPSIVTNFLTRIYDFIYAVLCMWVMIDNFKWCVDKFYD